MVPLTEGADKTREVVHMQVYQYVYVSVCMRMCMRARIIQAQKVPREEADRGGVAL